MGEHERRLQAPADVGPDRDVGEVAPSDRDGRPPLGLADGAKRARSVAGCGRASSERLEEPGQMLVALGASARTGLPSRERGADLGIPLDGRGECRERGPQRSEGAVAQAVDDGRGQARAAGGLVVAQPGPQGGLAGADRRD